MNSLAKIYQKPLDLIDGLLDGVTSYKLLLYFLIVLTGWATIISFGHKLPYSWHAIIFSSLLLVVVCRAFGEFFARVLNIARNSESDYITALILALILTPAANATQFLILAGAGFAAIASKYILTLHRQHIFNPAAVGAAISGLLFHNYASWWVGTAALAPLVIVGGLLIMRKMHRFLMIAIFTLTYGIFLHMQFDGASPFHTIWLTATSTAVMFFAFVMLIEPLTSPDSFWKYLPYSILIAILYGFNKLHVSPEEALLIGNVFAYAVVRGKRLQLILTHKNEVAKGIYDFSFEYHGFFDFKPGQYLEWTLPLKKSDMRGNRRYLTVSSSPTEHQISFTVRIPQKPSHFKQMLMNFQPGDKILASHLGGSFTMPKDQDYKLAFIAGGIGVTPFRSMIKYIIDKQQERDINLLYAAGQANEFAFADIFKQAAKQGLKTSYLATGKDHINAQHIKDAIPDYDDRIFYLSGPYGFVKAVRTLLLDLGVGPRYIHSDYFPGYN